jgi:hypothetical protein
VPACRRRVADSTAQPAGIAGSEKRTSERTLRDGAFDRTLRLASLPLLTNGALWSIGASEFAPTVCWEPQLGAVPAAEA